MKVVVGKVSDFKNGDRKIIDVNGIRASGGA